MKLEDFGWNPTWKSHLDNLDDPGLEPARVVRTDRNTCELATRQGSVRATVTGTFHNSVGDRADLPAVGDWVAFGTVGADHFVTAVLPRETAFIRGAAAGTASVQVLAANVDVAFLVCGMDGDLNTRRLERYLTLAWQSGATPVVLLNKSDLSSDPHAIVDTTRADLVGVDIHAVSAATGAGLEAIGTHIRPGRTLVLLGSSGAGKSSLANRLMGRAVQATSPVRASDDRGRHTTTFRELFLLPRGGILIDTPGLRELRLTGTAEGLGHTFAEIEDLARRCRFRDCRHEREPGCEVRAAVETGAIAERRYGNFIKMRREVESAELRESPHLVRRRDRRFAKLVRRVVDQKRRPDRWDPDA